MAKLVVLAIPGESQQTSLTTRGQEQCRDSATRLRITLQEMGIRQVSLAISGDIISRETSRIYRQMLSGFSIEVLTCDFLLENANRTPTDWAKTERPETMVICENIANRVAQRVEDLLFLGAEDVLLVIGHLSGLQPYAVQTLSQPMKLSNGSMLMMNPQERTFTVHNPCTLSSRSSPPTRPPEPLPIAA